MRRIEGARMAAAVTLMAWVVAAVAGAQDAAPVFTAAATVDRTALRIGERFDVVVTLEGAAPVASARPAVGQRLGDFEVLAIEPRGYGRWLGRAPRAWRLVLTSFEAGTRSLDGLTVEGTTVDGRAFVSSAAPAVRVDVSAPPASADDPLEPPDPARAAPGLPRAVVWAGRAALALGVALLAVLVGGPLWRRASTRLERSRRWRRLHRRLDAVTAVPGGDAAAARAHCDAVAAVLRDGSQYAAGRGLADLSTTELVEVLAATPRATGLAPALAPLLGELDVLRFAGRGIDAAAVSSSVDRARHVLRLAEAATRQEERRAS